MKTPIFFFSFKDPVMKQFTNTTVSELQALRCRKCNKSYSKKSDPPLELWHFKFSVYLFGFAICRLEFVKENALYSLLHFIVFQ